MFFHFSKDLPMMRWYFDETRTIPVTGGSISGNIRDVQGRMVLSKELQTENNFIGPKILQLFNVSITGRE